MRWTSEAKGVGETGMRGYKWAITWVGSGTAAAATPQCVQHTSACEKGVQHEARSLPSAAPWGCFSNWWGRAERGQCEQEANPD